MAAGDFILASDFRQGVIARADRGSSSAATITTEVGYLRLDNIQVYAGLAYRISTSPLALRGSVVGDVAEAKVRYVAAGTATTGGTVLNVVRQWADIAGGSTPDKTPMIAYYYPVADSSTFSVLLTVLRSVAGASSTGVQLLANETVQLVVECVGTAPADSGVSL